MSNDFYYLLLVTISIILIIVGLGVVGAIMDFALKLNNLRKRKSKYEDKRKHSSSN